jgi:uncharacterized protein YggU (UPF0235/DUF167 family)
MDDVKETLCVVGNPQNIPLIQTASILITKIIEICEAAEYNKKICNTLAERMEIARSSIELFKKYEKELDNKSYHEAFYKFIYVSENIKEYIEHISKIHGLSKYAKANSIKENFMKLNDDLAGFDKYHSIHLIETASILITKIIESCEANENICDTLAERMEITRSSIELLKKYERTLYKNSYYEAFHKFIYVLENIKEYTEDILKLPGFVRNYILINSIKEKFMKLTEECDNAMKNLRFIMTVESEGQIDSKDLSDVSLEKDRSASYSFYPGQLENFKNKDLTAEDIVSLLPLFKNFIIKKNYLLYIYLKTRDGSK